jgi:hypothetical protein
MIADVFIAMIKQQGMFVTTALGRMLLSDP